MSLPMSRVTLRLSTKSSSLQIDYGIGTLLIYMYIYSVGDDMGERKKKLKTGRLPASSYMGIRITLQLFAVPDANLRFPTVMTTVYIAV